MGLVESLLDAGGNLDARGAELAAMCGGDAQLLERAQELWESTRGLAGGLPTHLPPTIGVPPAPVNEDGLHPDADPTLPQVAGCDTIQMIGAGAVGRVYKAWQRRPGRLVAIKLPKAEAFRTRRQLHAFLAEARAAAGLSHPNICPVIAADWDDASGTPYLVMPFLPGGTLREWGSNGRRATGEVAGVVAALCNAVGYAHRKGIVHRDIKPDNVLMDDSDRPLVTDFGLATGGLQSVAAAGGHRGTPVGTPPYMAPELVSGAAADAPADVYALGATLYELLAGRAPFEGTRDRILHDILHAQPLPLKSVRPDVPEELEVICRRAMAKSPASRFVTAEGMEAALRRTIPRVTAKPLWRHPAIWLAVATVVITGAAAGFRLQRDREADTTRLLARAVAAEGGGDTTAAAETYHALISGWLDTPEAAEAACRLYLIRTKSAALPEKLMNDLLDRVFNEFGTLAMRRRLSADMTASVGGGLREYLDRLQPSALDTPSEPWVYALDQLGRFEEVEGRLNFDTGRRQVEAKNNRGDVPAAIAVAEKLLALRPAELATLDWTAVVQRYRQMSQSQAREELQRRAEGTLDLLIYLDEEKTKVRPEFQLMLIEKARLLRKFKKPGEAAAALQQVVGSESARRHVPGLMKAHLMLGFLKWDAGDRASAREQWRTGFALISPDALHAAAKSGSNTGLGVEALAAWSIMGVLTGHFDDPTSGDAAADVVTCAVNEMPKSGEEISQLRKSVAGAEREFLVALWSEDNTAGFAQARQYAYDEEDYTERRKLALAAATAAGTKVYAERSRRMINGLLSGNSAPK